MPKIKAFRCFVWQRLYTKQSRCFSQRLRDVLRKARLSSFLKHTQLAAEAPDRLADRFGFVIRAAS